MMSKMLFLFLTVSLSLSTISASAQTEVSDGQRIINRIAEGFKMKKWEGEYIIHDLKFLTVDSIKNERHSEIKVEIHPEGVVVQFSIDKAALEKPSLALTNFIMLNYLVAGTNPYLSASSSRRLDTLLPTLEIMKNAKAGSPTAQLEILEHEIRLLKSLRIMPEIPQYNNFQEQFARDQKELADKQIAYEEAAKKHISAQQKKIDQWRKETQTLEKYEAMDHKLNDLILKNDRKGVANMLRAYLPWAVMEPVEADAWKIWIEAIENPDKSKTTVAFRGLDFDTDKVQRLRTKKGEVIGLMSTILTKNQGSYTRRLRSLSINRLKNGSNDPQKGPIQTVRVATQIARHTNNPVGSNFLSFSYNPGVALEFMGQAKADGGSGAGFLAVRMDSRRLFPNLLTINGEAELLAPLIVFPDEVLRYHEGDFKGERFSEYRRIVQEVSEIAKIDFTKIDGDFLDPVKLDQGKTLKDLFTENGYRFFSEIISKTHTANSCSKTFL